MPRGQTWAIASQLLLEMAYRLKTRVSISE